jgi:hypothetical protein
LIMPEMTVSSFALAEQTAGRTDRIASWRLASIVHCDFRESQQCSWLLEHEHVSGVERSFAPRARSIVALCARPGRIQAMPD